MILTKDALSLQIYGESHGTSIGMKLSGIPCGEKIDTKLLQKYTDRRKPLAAVYSTSRLEPDELIIKSGIQNGKTTGTEINIEIKNIFARPKDYDDLHLIPRPGHADYPAFVKYGGKINMSGGGKYSGRLTAPLVAAGGIAVQILRRHGITVHAYISEIGGIKSASYKTHKINIKDTEKLAKPTDSMLSAIEKAKADGDSLGGIIECVAFGVPVGLGDAMFDSIESNLSALLFGVPAVKGVEFGSGFNLAEMTGSQANDQYICSDGKVQTKTNHNGGILGGMTNGSPLCCRVVVKPTPSIAKVQDSIDMLTKQNTKLAIKGRHDACIVPRAVVIIEACLALTILDGMYNNNNDKTTIQTNREKIDKIDDQIAGLFKQRMAIAKQIGYEKAKQMTDICDPKREQDITNRLIESVGEELSMPIKQLYEAIFSTSKALQTKIISEIRNKKFCLIGENLSHSYSSLIHKEFGYSYTLVNLNKNELANFCASREYDGFNVTIPYKKDIIQYLDGLDVSAENTGCVNTVVKRNNKLIGYNTDIFGLAYLADSAGINIQNKKVIILGSGGTAATASVLCKNKNARETIIISRSGENNYKNIERHHDAQIIINASPVGMYPNTGEKIINISPFKQLEGVIDVIYNPLATDLILQAKELGIKNASGLQMLVAQAKKARDIFLSDTADDNIIDIIHRRLQKEIMNIVLIGMPSAGKSTLGLALAKQLNRKLVDTDEEIVKESGKTIPQIFETQGEKVFRELEQSVLEKYGKEKGLVISCGGGAVVNPNAYNNLKQNGVIIHIQRDINKIQSTGRPLLKDTEAIQTIYAQRMPIYKKFADIEIDNNGEISDTLKNLTEKLNEYFGN